MWPRTGKLANRYVIERQIGAGGMGAVYRAMDERSGRLVALKLLPTLDAVAASRFQREARVLADLVHPGIVGYVDHGTDDGGSHFIAMEWLEGKDLSRHLEEGRLPVADALAMGRLVASALAFAHARGVVHRDVKPANLLVVDGDLRRVKLLDFGIARAPNDMRFTFTGEGIGTPGYLAPEQARGERAVGPTADVFSLGCVLYECFTGQRPFVADHLLALMAKILFEEAPRLSEAWPEAPEELEQAVAQMLEKDPGKRPRDGNAVVMLLDRAASALMHASSGARSRRALTESELRSAAVVVVEGIEDRYDLVRLLAAEHGARAEPVRGGGAALVFDAALAKDGAAQAARCALAIRELLLGVRVGVAIARASSRTVAGALGAVFDRAVGLLQAEPPSMPPSMRMRAGAAPPVFVDDVAAGLLDVDFVVTGRIAPFALLGERPVEEHRKLLGRSTTCVGRETELRTLEAFVDGAIEGPTARGLLVIGPAGAGKSRLRVELVRRLRQRDVFIDVWLGRAEPSGVTASYGLCAGLLGKVSGTIHAVDPAGRQRKLHALAATVVPEADVRRVAEFLGELVGARFSDEASVQLRTARSDPAVMADQIERAWLDFVRGASSRLPILLVLEDVHWADSASLRLIGRALAELSDQPIAMIATARPEGIDTLPPAWREKGIESLSLPGLDKKAIAALCVEALGDAGAKLADEVARLAAGNAFHAEELIRSAASGKRSAPSTVIAMLESRFDAIEPEARLVIRAASVFGERFVAEGLCALLGSRVSPGNVARHLADLRDHEILETMGVTSSGAAAFAFRHALVREAAYGTLTLEDRALGHRLAGAWLSSVGESTPVRLAEHFDRGDEPARALAWYVRGAERALELHDLDTALRCAERGLALGAAGEVLGTLRAIQAEACEWRGDLVAGARFATEAMALLPRGSGWWSRATAPLLGGVLAQGSEPPAWLVADLVELSLEPSRAASDADAGSRVLVVARTAAYLFLADKPHVVAPLLSKLAAVDEASLITHPQAAGWLACTRSLQAAALGDTAEALACSERSEAMFLRAGDMRTAGIAQVNNGCFLLALGAWERAATLSQYLAARAAQSGWSLLVPLARANLGLALLEMGRHAESEPILSAAEEALRIAQDRRMHGTVLCYQSRLAERMGRLDEAERHARRAVEVLEGTRPLCFGLATLAHALLAAPATEARNREALTLTQAALDAMTALGGAEEGESLIRLTHAEAIARSEGWQAAKPYLADACTRLRERAAKIGDASLRTSFLEGVRENARTLELGREHAGA